jgi:hypothetical protein
MPPFESHRTRRGPDVRPPWDFTWEIVRFFDRADILATFVDGEPVQINGRSTRFDSAAFLDDTEAEGVRSVREAKMIKLHAIADAGWPRAREGLAWPPAIGPHGARDYCPLADLAKPSSAAAMVLKSSSRSAMPCRALSTSGAV